MKKKCRYQYNSEHVHWLNFCLSRAEVVVVYEFLTILLHAWAVNTCLDLPLCTLCNFTPKPGLLFFWQTGEVFDKKLLHPCLPYLTIHVKHCSNQFWWFTSILYTKDFSGQCLMGCLATSLEDYTSHPPEDFFCFVSHSCHFQSGNDSFVSNNFAFLSKFWWECFHFLGYLGDLLHKYPLYWHFWIYYSECSLVQHYEVSKILWFKSCMPSWSLKRTKNVFYIKKITNFKLVRRSHNSVHYQTLAC